MQIVFVARGVDGSIRCESVRVSTEWNQAEPKSNAMLDLLSLLLLSFSILYKEEEEEEFEH